MHCGKVLLFTLLTCLALVALPCSGEGASLLDHATIISHDLKVELMPDTHELIAQDQIGMRIDHQSKTVTFTLAPTLQVNSIEILARTSRVETTPGLLPVTFTSELFTQPPAQKITVTLPDVHDVDLSLIWTYRGVIDDPPREPRHLRFVTPSETSGHIGPEGVYLSSESQWYPDIDGSLSSFRLSATVPAGWLVVTQGKEQTEHSQDGKTHSRWIVRDSSEALSLVANRFVVASRDWTSPDGTTIRVSTYLFPDNAHLADEYLDATQKYLQAYIPILGPYPFEKFAVVENFFASGLGMPSFTLLGSGSIKRHYVQPYALGHEIVHSWIGNAVFNRADRGNWVEGLTTYLANYYWHELNGDQQQARDQRRQMVQGYNLYVAPERDYPVALFRQKHDERDNAIGYQKAAMVFHHLRAEVGDQLFWQGLKRFVAHYRGRHAAWGDIEQVFSDESRRDLRWFFAQWVEQPGAPVLSAVEATVSAGQGGTMPFQLDLTIAQHGTPARILVPVRIWLEDRREEIVTVPVGSSRDKAVIPLPARPTKIELDPDFLVFRRTDRAAMPPVLNHYVTDARRSVVTEFSDRADRPSPLREVVARIEMQDSQKPGGDRTAMVTVGQGKLLPREGSVLLLGGPEYREAIQAKVAPHCGNRVSLTERGFTLDETAYEGPGMAVLLTCHRVDVPGSVVTLFYSMTPQAVTRVARLLFFYGWNSVIVFKDGSVVSRMEWQTDRAIREVHREGP